MYQQNSEMVSPLKAHPTVNPLIPSAQAFPGAVTLSAWVHPESDDFFLLIQMVYRYPRPLVYENNVLFHHDRARSGPLCLAQISMNFLGASGYLPLYQWSHLVLVYDLSSKKAQFFINGQFDSLTSLQVICPFPYKWLSSRSHRRLPIHFHHGEG